MTTIIGEAGVRVRPVSSGFSPELQALVDGSVNRVNAVLPITVSTGTADQQISDIRANAAVGAVFPLVVGDQAAQEAIATVKASALAGAELPVSAMVEGAVNAVADVKSDASAGVELPVEVQSSAAAVALDGLRSEAARPVEIPVGADTAAAAAAIQDTKDNAASTVQFQVSPQTGDSAAAVQRIKDNAASPVVFSVAADLTSAQSSVDGLQQSVARGVDLPIIPGTGSFDEAIAATRVKAEAGAEFPLLPANDSVEALIGTLRGQANVGAEFPLYTNTSPVEDALAQLEADAQNRVINQVIDGDIDAALDKIAQLRAAAENGVSIPMSTDTSQGIQGLQGLTGEAVQAQDAFGGLDSLVGDLRNQVNGLGGGLTSLASRLSVPGALIGAGAIGSAFAVSNVISAGQQRLTTIEDSVTALNIQLGGAEKSAKLVESVLKTVQGTPFTLDQFIQAARSLVTFGVEAQKIPTYLTAIGEAAAGSGQGIEAVMRITDVFSQMSATGRTSLDDVYRLGSVGVNALVILGNAFGKTTAEIRDMISNGAIPAKDAIDAIINGINNGSTGAAGSVNKLGGSMEALRDTFSGAAGGLEAASARLGVALLEPFRPATVSLIQTVTDVLDGIAPVTKRLLQSFVDTGVLADFTDMLKGIPDVVNDVVSGFEENGLAGALSTFVGPDVAGQIAAVLDSIISIGSSLIETFREGAVALAPIVTILGGGLLVALEKMASVLDPIIATLADADPTIQALAAAIAGLLVLKEFDPVQSVLENLLNTTRANTEALTAEAAAHGVDAAAARGNAAAHQQLMVAQAAAANSNNGDNIAAFLNNNNIAKQRQFLIDSNNALLKSTGTSNITKELADFDRSLTQSTGRFRTFANGVRDTASSVGSSIKSMGSSLFSAVGGWPTVAALAVVGTISVLDRLNQYSWQQAEESADQLTEKLRSIGEAANASFNEAVAAAPAFNAELDATLNQIKSLDTVDINLKIPGLDLVTGGGTSGLINSIINRQLDVEFDRTQEETIRKAHEELIAYTGGWGRLAFVVRDAKEAFTDLGLEEDKDAARVESRRKNIEALLVSKAKTSGLKGSALTQEIDNAKVNAATLASYTNFDEVLANAGISMDDISGMSAPELTAALLKSAEASDRGQTAAAGLNKALGDVVGAYKEGADAAKAFTAATTAQADGWLSVVSSADQFNTTMASLQYQTDFTAGSLSSVLDGAKATTEAVYTQVYAQATLNGSLDASRDAAAAATAKNAELRDSFIETATNAGYTRKEAEDLATALFGIPNFLTVQIQIKVAQEELDQAIAKQKELGVLRSVFGGADTPGSWLDVANKTKARDDAQAAAAWFGAVNKQQQADAQKRSQDLISSQQEKQAADQRRADAKRAADEAARDAKRAAEEAKRAAEQAAKEEERRVKEFWDAIGRLVDASDDLQSSFESTLDKLKQARDKLIGDLSKRVEFNTPVSVGRLIRNADQRNAALAETQTGIATLQQRGLTADALRAVGITGQAEDARAIRRLLKASPEELAQLSASVGTLTQTASQAAYREQGQIIAQEIRLALEKWAATPGAQSSMTTEQLLALLQAAAATNSNETARDWAARVTTTLTGINKR